MKYAESNSIGDAGEHLFAFMIATIFGWPCRLLDIDIGIDAQVEILDDERHSTGQFLAVQIKATNNSKLDSKYIPVSHVNYWKTVESPVLVALVDIEKKEVYVRPICKNTLDTPQKCEGDSYKIQFDKKKDLLCTELKPKLRELAFASDIHLIKKTLSEVRKECEQILEETNLQLPEKMIENPGYYLGLIAKFKYLESSLHESRILVDGIHQFVGDCDYQEVLDIFYSARKSLHKFFVHWHFYNHDQDAVIRFKNDIDNSSPHLEISTPLTVQPNLAQ
jgi:hypothetical protein